VTLCTRGLHFGCIVGPAIISHAERIHWGKHSACGWPARRRTSTGAKVSESEGGGKKQGVSEVSPHIVTGQVKCHQNKLPICQALDWLRICGALLGSVYLEMRTALPTRGKNPRGSDFLAHSGVHVPRAGNCSPDRTGLQFACRGGHEASISLGFQASFKSRTLYISKSCID